MLRRPFVNLLPDKVAEFLFTDSKLAVRADLATVAKRCRDQRLNTRTRLFKRRISGCLPGLCSEIRLGAMAMNGGLWRHLFNAAGDLVRLFGKPGDGVGGIDDGPCRATPDDIFQIKDSVVKRAH